MAYTPFGINYDTSAKISAYGGDAETPAQPIWAEDTNQLWIVHGTGGKYRVAMASELANYLTTATASATYLSKTDAGKTYLTQANASQTYLTQAAAGQTYLSKDDAASTYLGINAKAKTAGTADTAVTASKLGTANLGGANQTVYLAAGVAKAGNSFVPTTGGSYTGTVFAPVFQISSDLRIKRGIVPIEGALDKVLALGGYTYLLKGFDKRQAGVIAQEVEKVLPEAVTENAEGIKTVNYAALVALLIAAVKELKN
jgi:hypothetical protein|uniref:Neck appendage like protein n=1 Tax=Podoviridae sp. cta463 TaxID=2826561 RepID=A0A8S5QUA5_9CAUD|nr:MAG TPA: Neck appendage like protein [Podoviridae sp. cta463]